MDDHLQNTASQKKSKPKKKANSQGGKFRVDQAHAQKSNVPNIESPSEATELPSDLISEELPESVRRHLSQLIQQIQQQNEKLSHREATLNSQIADFESDLRSAKITLEERDAYIAERESSSDQLLTKIDADSDRLAEEKSSLEKRRKRIIKAQSALVREERRLQKEQKHVDQNKALIEKQHIETSKAVELKKQKSIAEVEARYQMLLQFEMQLEQRNQAITEKQKKWQTEFVPKHLWEETESIRLALDQRSQLLTQSEQLLEEEWDRLQEQSMQQEKDEETWQREVLDQKQRLDQIKQKCFTEIDLKQQELNQTESRLQSREASVKQMHQELSQTQKDVLEDRLVIEELWSKLQQQQDETNLTLEIATTRNRLVKAYREEAFQSQTMQEELLLLKQSLQQQREQMQQELDKARTWIQAQHQELEIQAARLVAKENKLAQEKSELDLLANQCNENLSLHRIEKRNLLSQVESLIAKSA